MKNDFGGLSAEEKKALADRLLADAESDEELPIWYDGKRIDEVAYCESLLERQEMRCINGRVYTMDGLTEDEKLQAKIAEELKPYIRSYLSKTAERFLQTLKVLCNADPIRPTADRIHFANGTYVLGEGFRPEREWTMNRLPIAYDPDAPAPERWLNFLAELLEETDILTLQEYLGYCLTATNRGQAMLLIIGKGGEGKSRISAVMQELFGANLCMGNISKLESDKFCPANLEGRLFFIDDDIKMEALNSTNTIKTIVTCDGMMELERKGRQAYQGMMYARLLCLGNGTLKSLHDKSRGFYRRQIILQTRPKPENRVDDPYLKDKLIAELPGILLWCLAGLNRLRDNSYRFTVSDRSEALKAQYVEDDNNIQGFLQSEGYVEFCPEGKCPAQVLYETYVRWCRDNAEKDLASTTFFQYLKDNADELKIRHSKNIPNSQGNRVRGYVGVRAVSTGSEKNLRFLPDDVWTPFD